MDNLFVKFWEYSLQKQAAAKPIFIPSQEDMEKANPIPKYETIPLAKVLPERKLELVVNC